MLPIASLFSAFVVAYIALKGVAFSLTNTSVCYCFVNGFIHKPGFILVLTIPRVDAAVFDLYQPMFLQARQSQGFTPKVLRSCRFHRPLEAVSSNCLTLNHTGFLPVSTIQTGYLSWT